MTKIIIGSNNFSEFIQSESLYIDKTLFIKEFLDSGSKVTLITRPRRWGKSLALSMLQHFLSSEVNGVVTKGMFDNLKIAKESDGKYIKKYQGQFPVVLISFKDLSYENYDKAVIVSGDGDFRCLHEFLNEKGKLLRIIIPNEKSQSSLLRPFEIYKTFLAFEKGKLELKPKKKRGASHIDT